ncbi:DE-cadherin-like [Anopheles marshallii]|uniref:DE-cadherin-like n=1 Tax=Anopheles marshallii TaxID=1521116 RepID=UPI00237AB6A2|nr:DE-cadherin-like [Anopheles marshallii]
MANRGCWSILVFLLLLASCNSSSVPRVQAVNDISTNHKPRFHDCTHYEPTLRKEQPTGTPVLRVTASDPDQGQTLEYSIATMPEDQNYFNIDKTTGQIVSAHVFDRDAPIRDREINLTVRATDNGSPTLADVCTIKVTILDINDDPSIFQECVYQVSVTKDLPLNQSLATISAMDLEEGDNNRIKYEIVQEHEDSSYFDIDESNGLLTLAKPIDRSPGQFYTIHVRAYSEGSMENQTQQTKVMVRVLDPNDHAPYFIKMPMVPVMLKETFQHYNMVLAEYEAVSNVKKDDFVDFQIVQGNTDLTFLLDQINNTVAYIKLRSSLDYERTTNYTLVIRATNSLNEYAEVCLTIMIVDENDNYPVFDDDTGTILEYELPGTFVMQVHARDDDGTAPNNIVSYRLADTDRQYFQIDSQTGIITSMVKFDRETKNIYVVRVTAEDNAPSVEFKNGSPNSVTKHFLIQVLPRNYYNPQFEKRIYRFNYLSEDTAIGTKLIQVKAYDKGKHSSIKYSILKNNVGDAFKIDENTGVISVNNQLDYEAMSDYKLYVKADNGLFHNSVIVRFEIVNVNDNAPIFINLPNVTIPEETISPDCIAIVKAYDPDTQNSEIPQGIQYTLEKELEQLLEIDDSGCVRLLKPLDRDPPDGAKLRHIKITATDENGKGQDSTGTLNITLEDINDNAPYLTNTQPIAWGKNRTPGRITKLTAQDADEDQNGPPFVYSIDPEAPLEIRQRFQIVGDELHALNKFDRDDPKEYSVPILVRDSGDPPMSAISTLQIVIGDENDNKKQQSKSDIVVYKYKGKTSDIDIGRAHVNDADGLDLSNKTFLWDEVTSEESLKLFQLNFSTGMITMLEATPCGQYDLRFQVVQTSDHRSRHNVSARATVLVKEVSEQSIDQSGSIRFYNVTADEFISQTPEHRSTPLHRLQTSIATVLNVSSTDVDIFTVNNRKLPKLSFLDVFFAVNGSVYSTSEVLNGVLSYQLHQLEEDVGFPIEVVGIDECELQSSTCEQSCRNKVHKSPKPIVVYGNATSFIGITTFVEAECVSDTPLIMCLNGGTLESNSCICPNGFEGPQCELIDICFDGNGYAIYPSIIGGTISNISIEMLPQRTDGLVLYIGPMRYNPRVKTQPFLALEIIDSMVVLLLDYGTGTFRIQDQQIFSQYDLLRVDISLKPETIEMNTLKNKVAISNSRYKNKDFGGSIKTHGPVQLGGTIVDFTKLGSLYNWTYIPQTKGFNGSLRILTINGRTIDFQQHNLAQNLHSSIIFSKKNNKGVKKTTNQHSQPLLNNNKTSIGVLEKAGDLKQLEDALATLDVDVVALQEIRWPGNGVQNRRGSNNHYNIYYGCHDRHHMLGTGFALGLRLKSEIIGFQDLLVNIFNRCMELCYCPQAWKCAKVIPILKLGKDPSSSSSYRPISLLSALGKLFEKLIYFRLRDTVEDLQLLPPEQFGFRSGHSTTT